MEITQRFSKQTELCRELLTGSICYTSRKKLTSQNQYKEGNSSEVSFGTLHSLTSKVTKNAYLDNMHSTVKLAMTDYILKFNENLSLSDETIQDYYLAIRKFENNDNDHPLIRKEGSNFYQIYDLYLSIKGSKWDWEDSLIIASEYLNSDIISPFFFPFDNLVFINYEQVININNLNAFQFYFSLCNFFYRHRTCNCYFLSNDNILYKFNGNDALLTSVNPNDTSKKIGFI